MNPKFLEEEGFSFPDEIRAKTKSNSATKFQYNKSLWLKANIQQTGCFDCRY
jgi:hypothetical protein